jgi:voltage-gated potassium channel
MKLAAAMISMLAAPLAGGKARALIRLGIVFAVSVTLFSVGFHVIMGWEGREFTWWTSIYWTIVTMTTLGFGDIVFESDLGRMYSVLVLLTGALLLLILLPFTFIQLVYLPWRAAVRDARTPRSLPDGTHGHLLLTGQGPMERALMSRAETAGLPYFLILEDIEEASTLHDDGMPVLVGALDDPATYRAAHADHAAMVVAAGSDQANTNVAFTVREVTDAGILVATANSKDSVDVLHLAGADHVLQLGEILGQAFARRILAPSARSSVIATFAGVVVAETSVSGTELAGRTLADLGLRERFGLSAVGVWDRGSLHAATAHQPIADTAILLLAGTRDQVDAYDEAFGGHAEQHPTDGAPVVVLGGGRVGRATARALRAAGTPCRVVERLEERVRGMDDVIIGDAADLEVLRKAGIDEAAAVVITTHDDDTNIYLTLYCRRLRPHAEILGRVALDRNVSTMHRAGADFVLSYASMGSIEAWNALRRDSTMLLAEGLVLFRVPMPPGLAGTTLRDADLPRTTGCTVVGIMRNGTCASSIDPDQPLPADGQLVLIGDDQAEARFYARHVKPQTPSGVRGLVARLRPGA